jgi:hypothetical protein
MDLTYVGCGLILENSRGLCKCAAHKSCGRHFLDPTDFISRETGSTNIARRTRYVLALKFSLTMLVWMELHQHI